MGSVRVSVGSRVALVCNRPSTVWLRIMVAAEVVVVTPQAQVAAEVEATAIKAPMPTARRTAREPQIAVVVAADIIRRPEPVGKADQALSSLW